MFLTYGLAYSQVFDTGLRQPRRERSPQEFAVLAKRLGAATRVIALLALALSLTALALSACTLAKVLFGA